MKKRAIIGASLATIAVILCLSILESYHIHAANAASAAKTKAEHSGTISQIPSLPSDDVRQLLDTTDGHFIFAVTASGLFRSTDNGQTWANTTQGLQEDGTNLNDSVYKAQIDDSGSIWVRAGIGLFRSDDNGETWIQESPDNVFVQDFAVSTVYTAIESTKQPTLRVYDTADLTGVENSASLSDAWDPAAGGSPVYSGGMPAGDACAQTLCFDSYLESIADSTIAYHSQSNKLYTFGSTGWKQFTLSSSANTVPDGFSGSPFVRDPGLFLVINSSTLAVSGIQANGQVQPLGTMDKNPTSTIFPMEGQAYALIDSSGYLIEGLKSKSDQVVLSGQGPAPAMIDAILDLDSSHVLVGASDSGLYEATTPPGFISAAPGF